MSHMDTTSAGVRPNLAPSWMNKSHCREEHHDELAAFLPQEVGNNSRSWNLFKAETIQVPGTLFST